MTDILLNKLRRRKANAIFDFDGTLVKPKEGRRFPKDEHDWQYLRPSVPVCLKKICEDPSYYYCNRSIQRLES